MAAVGYYRRLATPKSIPAAFHEDKLSVYWENGLSKDHSKTTAFVVTKRQAELANTKKLDPDFYPDRPSPIWKVSASALTAQPTERIQRLALPKIPHPNYRPCKPVTTIPKAALLATPSPRLSELARHKTFPLLLIKPQSEWDWSAWESDISPAALNATPSERVSALAMTKNTHEKYEGPRSAQWKVSKEARNYLASDRITKLSRPKNKHEDTEDYDPYAYVVSRSALITQPSPRIEQLATPLPRKVRTKK